MDISIRNAHQDDCESLLPFEIRALERDLCNMLLLISEEA